MNNYQQEIRSIFETATTSIQVAVSWFTDEFLINLLIKRANKVRIELLLSSDEVNLLRHKNFKQLQLAGAKVNKIGSDSAIHGEFMHSKFIIIDEKYAYGGSYNFTDNAKSNFENFNQLAFGEVQKMLQNFKNWFNRSIDFFKDITNADEIVRKLKQKFIEEEEQKQSLINRMKALDFSERDYIQQKEKQQVVQQKENALAGVMMQVINEDTKKEKLRETANNISSNSHKITSNGSISQNEQGISSKPHRFYGGSSISIFTGNKQPRSFGLAYYQKLHIEKNFDFLKCRIENDTLICTGFLQPETCDRYKVRILFRAGHFPQVFILSPNIEPRADIHIYKEGSLCLFYPGDLKWKDITKIAEYTIPWIVEWIVYYELWKLTGEWEGAEKTHVENVA
ncbi:MAG: phospholipase D-like domain-containing protein [Bacteroidia bacterium]